jgi:serine/threonine protein kinase
MKDTAQMLGQVLGGRYRVLRVLGAGSFGQTFLAEDTHRPDLPKCVVKYLKPTAKDISFLPIARDLFAREAIVLEKLGHHEQIPRLLAYFEQDQEFFLVQEFIEGQVLSAELKQDPPGNEAQVVRLLQDVLPILEFVHQCGVIHRDVKPDNLIRRWPDGKLVLIDFGAVKQVQVSLEARSTSTIAIGTPGYMPPEQSQGRPRPNSDLYALGVIGIQILTGLLPAQLQRDERGEIDWVQQTQTSRGLVSILNKMVCYYFQDRYQTATEVLQALDRLTHSPQLLQKLGRLLRTPIGRLTSASPSTPSSADASRPALEQRGGFSDSSSLPHQPLETLLPQTCLKAKIFISYRNLEPEHGLAQRLRDAFAAAGYESFMSGEVMQLGDGWLPRINHALKACDFFLVLLSPQSAHSEIVLEEIRTVKALQDLQSLSKPVILPIRVNLPLTSPLNYELRGHLHRIQQRIWKSPADEAALIQEILAVVDSSPESQVSREEPTTSGVLPTVPPAYPKRDTPPLPVAEPELPEGQMSLASSFYVERSPIESRCYETILQPGSLIRIKAPRQMGKTSLMARTLHHAAQQNCRSVSLSLQLADSKVFTDLDKFLRWLCASVGRRLQLPNQMPQYWDDIFGSKYNCTAYFEEYLLPSLNVPLVLGLDEVDRVFTYPEIASDFFGLLRAWHEEAKNRDVWKKLRLVVVHSTEVYIPLNVNQSPFNVGLPIELPEFDVKQVAQLAQRYGLPWGSSEISQLMTMVGGHPYLVRLAMYHIARNDTTLTTLLQSAPTETGLYRDHLHSYLWNLQQHPELIGALQQVMASPEAVQLESQLLFRLHSLGLIRLEGNQAKLRCELYRQYFQQVSTMFSGLAASPV